LLKKRTWHAKLFHGAQIVPRNGAQFDRKKNKVKPFFLNKKCSTMRKMFHAPNKKDEKRLTNRKKVVAFKKTAVIMVT
jgi:ribosomal protein L24E